MALKDHDRSIGSTGIGFSAEGTPYLVQDNSCAGSDMWIFSGTNLTGNEICFYLDANGDVSQQANAAVNLANYCFFVGVGCNGNWAGKVGSWWAGQSSGLWDTSVGGQTQYQFNNYQEDTNMANPTQVDCLNLWNTYNYVNQQLSQQVPWPTGCP